LRELFARVIQAQESQIVLKKKNWRSYEVRVSGCGV
jgi:hypothetical protein